jgi:hypothetical protein
MPRPDSFSNSSSDQWSSSRSKSSFSYYLLPRRLQHTFFFYIQSSSVDLAGISSFQYQLCVYPFQNSTTMSASFPKCCSDSSRICIDVLESKPAIQWRVRCLASRLDRRLKTLKKNTKKRKPLQHSRCLFVALRTSTRLRKCVNHSTRRSQVLLL